MYDFYEMSPWSDADTLLLILIMIAALFAHLAVHLPTTGPWVTLTTAALGACCYCAWVTL